MRTFAAVVTAILVAGALYALPATADTAIQVSDPSGDANFLNDQGNRRQIGFQGNVATPGSLFEAADIRRVWFTNEVSTISIHFQTENAPPGAIGVLYEAFTTPGTGRVASSVLGCLRWLMLIPGEIEGTPTTYRGDATARLVDRCNYGSDPELFGTSGDVSIEASKNGSGTITATFDRAYSRLLEDGRFLTEPFAQTRVAIGMEGFGSADGPVIDNTDIGRDYLIHAGTQEPDEPSRSEPPPPPHARDGDEEGHKARDGSGGHPGKGHGRDGDPPGCSRGKGQKKGCRKH